MFYVFMVLNNKKISGNNLFNEWIRSMISKLDNILERAIQDNSYDVAYNGAFEKMKN